ncbi:uncharacterized protein [Lolium perenne]|uniref:uncharacterized protein isoform X1 n=1 Tax=Lolium perenne TaxID=4522 RepID=UPI0021F57104|nr:uncharacterized protein LOC127332056 isoform X1 [Lolium perenne]
MYPPCPFLVHQMVHFDFPRADERQICSIQCCGQGKLIVSPPRGSSRDRLAALRSYPGPVIVVFVDRNGKYLTDYGSVGIHLRHMHRLLLQVVKRLEGDAKPLQQSDTTRLDELSITATSSSYKQDTIWLRPECTWGLDFYTRVDHAGSFHTYPHVGRPSHNLDEVSEAIDRYLFRHLDPKMHREQDLVSQENKCTLEMAIWRHIHWPDGTRKSHLRTLPLDERRCSMLQLVKALMDKYNDDHNLSGDLAYELPCVGRYRYFHDADIKGIYYHINFTANTKVSDDSGLDNLLFFAELVERGRNELVVSCICRVNPSEARGCYACLSDVYHPKADSYSGGRFEDCRSRGMFCCDGPEENLGCTPSELEAEEMSARSMYEGLDPSCFLVRQNQVRC